jgi:hypothetical protein
MNMNLVMQKIAEVAPKEHNFLLKTASEVKDSPFQEEIFEEMNGLVKSASPMQKVGGFLDQLGQGAARTMGGVGAAAAAGIAYSLAGDLYEAARRGLTKTRHYKAMLKENPDLADIPAKDVQKTFSVLHRFNPDFASDPYVAGQFVRQQARLASPFDTQQLSTLIGARKNLGDIRKLPTVTKAMDNPFEMGDEGSFGSSLGERKGSFNLDGGGGGGKWNPPSPHSGAAPNKPGESYGPTARGGWVREKQQFHGGSSGKGQRTKP